MYLILRISINVKLYSKKENFGIYLSIVHISPNSALRNVKFRVAADDIHLERIVSQKFDLCLSFCFMSKNGQLFDFFWIFFLQNFMKNELAMIRKI